MNAIDQLAHDQNLDAALASEPKAPKKKFYINNLQDENAQLKKKLAEIEGNLNALNLYLHSDKFRNDDSGDRKDWIATTDVINWIQETKRQL